MTTSDGAARIHWIEHGEERSARWRSESGWPAPKKVVLADDTMNADAAWRLALDGTALLWRGDFQNARQLLQALVRRVDHKGPRARRAKGGNWGWQKRSDLKPEFSGPLFSLKKGEASAPILLPEGCFLLYVEDRKYAGIQPIDAVRDDIERILVQQMAHTSQEHWLERLRRDGYVKHY